MSIVYCDIECGGDCKNCNEYSEEYGCMLRPCNRDKAKQLDGAIESSKNEK